MIFTNWGSEINYTILCCKRFAQTRSHVIYDSLADPQLIDVGSKNRTVCDDLKNMYQFLGYYSMPCVCKCGFLFSDSILPNLCLSFFPLHLKTFKIWFLTFLFSLSVSIISKTSPYFESSLRIIIGISDMDNVQFHNISILYLYSVDMLSQINGHPYGGSGDIVPPPHIFIHPQPPPVPARHARLTHPTVPGTPPEDAAFYFDGESYVSVGVSTDASGDFKLTLPDAHPDRCSLPGRFERIRSDVNIYLTRSFETS